MTSPSEVSQVSTHQIILITNTMNLILSTNIVCNFFF